MSALRQPLTKDAGQDRDGPAGRRFFDSAKSTWMIKVFPGEYSVTGRPDETLVTVLGSCVSACIRDPRTGFGGMNHFMLPDGSSSNREASARYGGFAMEKLINELIKGGCRRESMEIKVFGGGNLTGGRVDVGAQNAEFVLRYLAAEGLTCAVQDLGGPYARRILYAPTTGRVERRLLKDTDARPVTLEETQYARRLADEKPAGEVQLWG